MMTPLPGSERAALPGEIASSRARPDEKMEITLVMSQAFALPASVPATRESYAAAASSYPADMEPIRKFAEQNNLSIASFDQVQRTCVLAGQVGDFEKAFGIQLMTSEHEDGTHRTRVGPLNVPAALLGGVAAVLGLDNRPAAKPHFRKAGPILPFADADPFAARAMTPAQVAAAYGLPAGLGGAPQTIGIVSLGGGFKPSDITAYFSAMGLPQPKIAVVSVGGATNQPGSDADVENLLDIMVSASIYSIMTGLPASVAVYFAPNTTAGFYSAFSAAVHDQINKPCVISCSWGSPESYWTQMAMRQYDQLFQTAAMLGVSITAASGDNGSSDGVDDGRSHVDFPASSPNGIACGGTRLVSSPYLETVWNNGVGQGATGGGYSSLFAKPSWQGSQSATRGVGDVAGNADPQSGWVIRADGQNVSVGGTSAVSPMWAGIIAAVAGKRSMLLPALPQAFYSQWVSLFRDVSQGNNGAYQAAVGWDPPTGLGTPTAALISAMIGTAPAPPTPPPTPTPVSKVLVQLLVNADGSGAEVQSVHPAVMEGNVNLALLADIAKLLRDARAHPNDKALLLADILAIARDLGVTIPSAPAPG